MLTEEEIRKHYKHKCATGYDPLLCVHLTYYPTFLDRNTKTGQMSIRKDIDIGFTFPKPIKLTTQMTDLLEDDIPEKYYLTKEHFDAYERKTIENKEKGLGFKFTPKTRHSLSLSLER